MKTRSQLIAQNRQRQINKEADELLDLFTRKGVYGHNLLLEMGLMMNLNPENKVIAAAYDRYGNEIETYLKLGGDPEKL